MSAPLTVQETATLLRIHTGSVYCLGATLRNAGGMTAKPLVFRPEASFRQRF
jgi:hypothetical protein